MMDCILISIHGLKETAKKTFLMEQAFYFIRAQKMDEEK